MARLHRPDEQPPVDRDHRRREAQLAQVTPAHCAPELGQPALPGQDQDEQQQRPQGAVDQHLDHRDARQRVIEDRRQAPDHADADHCPEALGPFAHLPILSRRLSCAGSPGLASAARGALPPGVRPAPERGRPDAPPGIFGQERMAKGPPAGAGLSLSVGKRVRGARPRFPSSPDCSGNFPDISAARCGSRCSSCAPTRRSPAARSGRSRAGSRRSRSW